MDFIDYYKVLGVNKKANKKFQQLNEANEVLSDPEKRKKYDQYGKDWQQAEAYEKAQQAAGAHGRRGPGGFGGFEGTDEGAFGGFGNEWHTSDGGEFSDFFESLFGRGSSRSSGGGQARFRGQDYQAELSISLADAATPPPRVLT